MLTGGDDGWCLTEAKYSGADPCIIWKTRLPHRQALRRSDVEEKPCQFEAQATPTKDTYTIRTNKVVKI